jgi:anti-sigma-K factor RskA
LTPRAALERVARELPQSVDEIARTLDATAWRAALVAEPLHALLSGQTALTVAGAQGGDPHVARVSTTGGAQAQ